MVQKAQRRKKKPDEKSKSSAKSISPPKPLRTRIGERFSRRLAAGAALAAVLLIAAAVVGADWWISIPDDAPNGFVGRRSCLECHADQGRAFHGSHHDRAMDLAKEQTVLGDFNDAQLEHFGIVSRMFRRDGKYMIHTEGPDGKMADFEIKYVFGVDPLQQYMVEFDRPKNMPKNETARVQVLRISWDTHKKRWFYLPPPDVDTKLAPDDDLHWTGIGQRWNTMCADCHSTNLHKNYDVDSGVYHTTYAEIDVSCEACHGPGEIHVKLAKSKSLFWDRKRGYGLVKLKDKNPRVEIETCAPCHSRRRIVHPDFRPGKSYHDYFANEFLQPNTYHADGQIMDEVYVYGSFLQSKMYHQGIRCTDCHDPHSAQLKHQGNQVCTSCHAHPAGKYDSPSHHHHQPGSAGASCVECHMPETVYMEVDPRRDHSLRIPRPDLSVELGTPNACSRCHFDRDPSCLQDRKTLSPEKRKPLKQYNDWVVRAGGDEQVKGVLQKLDTRMTRQFQQWYRQEQYADRAGDEFAAALTLARRGDVAAEENLIRVAGNRALPAIERASALSHLLRFDSQATVQAGATALLDPSPQVRMAGLPLLETAPADVMVKATAPLLSDPSRMVRLEAGRLLSRVSPNQLTSKDRKLLDTAIEELKLGVEQSNDRAAAHLSWGVIMENLGDMERAQQSYLKAMRVQPGFTGSRSNLAALLESRSQQAKRQAQRAVQSRNQQQFVEASKLAGQLDQQVRELRAEELKLIARDVRLLPQSAALQHRYGLALYLHERLDEAENAFRKAVDFEPYNPDFVMALALFYEKQKRWEEALAWGSKLTQLRLENAMYRRILNRIRSEAAKQ